MRTKRQDRPSARPPRINDRRTSLPPQSRPQWPERYGMAGEERAMLYWLAVETGLRAGELRSLTRSSFDLKANPPTVTVEAGYSNRRRQDTLPLRPEIANALATFLGTKTPAQAFRIPVDRHKSAG